LADFDWLVVMGGPMNIYEEGRYPWLAEEKAFIARAIENQKVVLGICLGAQLIADGLGARISSNQNKEIGWYPVYRTSPRAQFPQLAAMEEELEALHWHADTFDLPAGAVHLARSEGCENQAFVYDHRVVGLQFHLEMTREGLQALLQHCAGDLTAGPFVQPAEAMLTNPLQFQQANRIMCRMLDGLAGLDRI
jgi:GMP synthase (glutamine-hydrolysing)